MPLDIDPFPDSTKMVYFTAILLGFKDPARGNPKRMKIAYLVVRSDHASVRYRTIQFVPIPRRIRHRGAAAQTIHPSPFPAPPDLRKKTDL